MKIAWILLGAAGLLAAQQIPGRGPLQLSLERAVELATSREGNTRIQLSGEALKQVEARSAQARAALLPDLSAAASAQNRTTNLAAMGVRLQAPIPGFQFPTLVGPFTTVDARVSGTQSVFDFASIRRFQASKAAVSAAHGELDTTAEQVSALVARAYLAAIRAGADVEAAEANVRLAESVLSLAENQKSAGTGTGIEITRARVQLANERQRLVVQRNAQRSASLTLARAIGLRLDTDLELTDRMAYIPVDEVTLDQARAAAVKQRPDLKAQQEREVNARLSASATKLERLPTVAAFGDYGSIGTGLDSALPTRTVGLSVRLPIFDGGRRDARRAESASAYRAERVRTNDLKEQIELDVRLALDALRSADEQVKVAREGLQLAEAELAQAERRYQAGVASGLEVTDAQTRLARARDNNIAALFSHNVARIDLAQAMGNVRAAVR